MSLLNLAVCFQNWFRRTAVLAICFLRLASPCFLVTLDLGKLSYLPRFYCSRWCLGFPASISPTRMTSIFNLIGLFQLSYVTSPPQRFGSFSTKPNGFEPGRCRVVKSSELPLIGILGIIGASAFHVGQVGGERGNNMDHHRWLPWKIWKHRWDPSWLDEIWWYDS